MPTDFQLLGKWNKFYFRFSFFFAAKNRNWTSIFVFHFFPAGKETESEFTLCSPFFLFCNFWKHGFSFSFWFFGFLVFRFRMELGKRITSRFPFLANGSETDNLCLSGEYLGNKDGGVRKCLRRRFCPPVSYRTETYLRGACHWNQGSISESKGLQSTKRKRFCNHQGIRKKNANFGWSA